MKPKLQESLLREVLPLVIQTGVGIIILLIARAVITDLDMVREIDIPVDFTFPQLLSAVILTIIVVVLLNFGTRMELRLARIVTDFPQSGQIVKLFVFLIAIGIAYGAYIPLLRHYWGDFDWAYHLSFLILFVVVLGMLGHTIYTQTERVTTLITGLFSGAKQTIPISGAEGLVCAACGGRNKAGASFCTSCGGKLSPLETGASNCKGCGAALKPNTRFCVSCGLPVGEASSQETD
ncbi:zinc ribbon domain-containing protein [Dehalococcoidia bacterium]|nr:zinc ribbon domain-containing protein [Dehalococcoidia bacterium]MCL0065010.1 zinc ribbon domain-containing protein [Dehalococcoidia bacterium]